MGTSQGGGMMGNGLGVGNGIRLRMGLYDHYRHSRYFGYRLFDETKVKI
jgi:hypothetical protein